MIHKQKPFPQIIDEIRNLGEQLIPYNHPKVPESQEDDIAMLKSREVMVDGYSVVLHYCKSDFDTHYMETLQVYGTVSPFLPFSIVCKLGQMFLGSHNLSLVELFKDQKIYCWTVCVDKQGKPCPSPFDVKTEKCTYQGLEYEYMLPDQVNFF